MSLPRPWEREPYCIHSTDRQPQPASMCCSETCNEIYARWVSEWKQWYSRLSAPPEWNCLDHTIELKGPDEPNVFVCSKCDREYVVTEIGSDGVPVLERFWRF